MIQRLSSAAQAWLDTPENQGRSTQTLRWHALAAIGDLVGDDIPDLLARFPDSWPRQLTARLRNGDLQSGVQLFRYDLPVALDWGEDALKVLRERRATSVTEALIKLLDDADASSPERNGLLGLSGAWGDPALGAAGQPRRGDEGARVRAVDPLPPRAVHRHRKLCLHGCDRAGRGRQRAQAHSARPPPHCRSGRRWERHGRGRIGFEAYYTGKQALEDNPYRTESRPYLHAGILGEIAVGRVRLFANAENILGVRQTRYDPLLLPQRLPDGRWTVDVWAPTEGFILNAGVRLRFGSSND
ncbi:MAG TPA: hypothetical protein VF614_10190 [Chthoniobacteraceae bacterium]